MTTYYDPCVAVIRPTSDYNHEFSFIHKKNMSIFIQLLFVFTSGLSIFYTTLSCVMCIYHQYVANGVLVWRNIHKPIGIAITLSFTLSFYHLSFSLNDDRWLTKYHQPTADEKQKLFILWM